MADRESNPTATLRKPAPRRDGQGRLTLSARALKVTLVLDPAQLAAVRVPDGVSAATLISPISAHPDQIAAREKTEVTELEISGGSSTVIDQAPDLPQRGPTCQSHAIVTRLTANRSRGENR